MINKENLLNLGFKEHFVSEEESGDCSFYYYTYDINNDTILISNSSNSCLNEKYVISFFNYNVKDINNYDILVELIDVLNKINK